MLVLLLTLAIAIQPSLLVEIALANGRPRRSGRLSREELRIICHLNHRGGRLSVDSGEPSTQRGLAFYSR